HVRLDRQALGRPVVPVGVPRVSDRQLLDGRVRSALQHRRLARGTMTQNIYDNEEFFEGYSRLPRSVEGLDGAPEWTALRALLPDLRGLDVLDLGCGFGWFCRWARQKGAAHVLGIDVSERMLARSRATTQDAAITYTRADMEHLELSLEAFNLVYRSLAVPRTQTHHDLISEHV